jgi:hypothetical protein
LIPTVSIKGKVGGFIDFKVVTPDIRLSENKKIFLNLIRIFVLLKEKIS